MKEAIIEANQAIDEIKKKAKKKKKDKKRKAKEEETNGMDVDLNGSAGNI